MNYSTTTEKLKNPVLIKSALYSLMAIMILSSCASSDDETPIDLSPKVIKIDNLTVKSYDAPQSNPAYQGSTTYLLGIFPKEPNATRYTVVYTNTKFPNLSFSIMWDAGKPVPSPGALTPTTPGYVDGLIGNDYYVAATTSGCQGSVSSGVCALDGVNTLSTEDGVAALGGSMEVTIEFD